MTLEDLYRLLRSSHVQSQGVFETISEPLVVLDRSMSVINANPAFYHSFRTEREDTIGRSLFELGNGQWDIPELRLLLAEVVPQATAVVGYEVKHDFPDIGQRTMLVTARRLSHPDDNSTQMLVVFEDVTARQNEDAAKDIILAETRHRMKNLLASVRAILNQAQVRDRTATEFRDAVIGRFTALLDAQEFINDGGEDGAELASLVAAAVRPIGGDRISLTDGPTFTLDKHQIGPMAMILHELGTNALKYGALSSDAGSVHLGWERRTIGGKDHLLLTWREQGGPPVKQPERRGFGTDLIEYSSQAEGGGAEFDFNPNGLRVVITLPITG
mgnify:CR=1 FL=1